MVDIYNIISGKIDLPKNGSVPESNIPRKMYSVAQGNIFGLFSDVDDNFRGGAEDAQKKIVPMLGNFLITAGYAPSDLVIDGATYLCEISGDENKTNMIVEPFSSEAGIAGFRVKEKQDAPYRTITAPEDCELTPETEINLTEGKGESDIKNVRSFLELALRAANSTMCDNNWAFQYANPVMGLDSKIDAMLLPGQYVYMKYNRENGEISTATEEQKTADAEGIFAVLKKNNAWEYEIEKFQNQSCFIKFDEEYGLEPNDQPEPINSKKFQDNLAFDICSGNAGQTDTVHKYTLTANPGAYKHANASLVRMLSDGTIEFANAGNNQIYGFDIETLKLKPLNGQWKYGNDLLTGGVLGMQKDISIETQNVEEKIEAKRYPYLIIVPANYAALSSEQDIAAMIAADERTAGGVVNKTLENLTTSNLANTGEQYSFAFAAASVLNSGVEVETKAKKTPILATIIAAVGTAAMLGFAIYGVYTYSNKDKSNTAVNSKLESKLTEARTIAAEKDAEAKDLQTKLDNTEKKIADLQDKAKKSDEYLGALSATQKERDLYKAEIETLKANQSAPKETDVTLSNATEAPGFAIPGAVEAAPEAAGFNLSGAKEVSEFDLPMAVEVVPDFRLPGAKEVSGFDLPNATEVKKAE
jgi:hypothetical protein